MPKMTPERLAQFEEMLKEASELPWKTTASGWSRDEVDQIVSNGGVVIGPQDEQGGPSWVSDYDAALIVEAVNAFPIFVDMARLLIERCFDVYTDRSNEHQQHMCLLMANHGAAHNDCAGTTWTH